MNACYALELTSMKTTNTFRKEQGTEFRCCGLAFTLIKDIKVCKDGIPQDIKNECDVILFFTSDSYEYYVNCGHTNEMKV